MIQLFTSKRFQRMFVVGIAFFLACAVLAIFAVRIPIYDRSYSVSDFCRLAILYYKVEHPGAELGNPFAETTSQKVKKALGGHPIELAFNWGPAPYILVPANIGGLPVSLELDTGSYVSIIWKHDVARLAKSDGFCTIAAGPKRTQLNFCHVPEMQIGPLKLQNITVFSPQQESFFRTVAGLLGAPILRLFTITIDYQTKHVILADPSEVVLLSKEAVIVPLIERDKMLCVEKVTLDGRNNLTALLDTGSPDSYVTESVAKSVLNHAIVYSGDTLPGDLYMGGRAISCQRFKQLQVGQLKVIAPIISATTELATKCDLLLGNNFFSHFKRVTFDYRNKRAIFEPYQANEPTAPELFALGRYYLSQKDDRAIATFHKVIALDNELVGVYPCCADAYERKGQFEQAIAECEKAISFDPQNASAYIERGSCFIILGQFQKAIADFDKAISLNPENASAYLNRGYVFLKLEEFKQALADFDKAISLDPQNASAYTNRGYGFTKLGQSEKAIADFDKAISLDARLADAYIGRAWIYEQLGKTELAENDKQMAKQLGSRG